jgi:hypothetical protein
MGETVAMTLEELQAAIRELDEWVSCGYVELQRHTSDTARSWSDR